MKSTKRKYTRKIRQKPHHDKSLQKSYGVVILPKGFKLYHASVSQLCTIPNKPVIFTTLHPSEWYYEDAYISIIELQRDVTLLFMIQTIRQLRLFSSLNTFLGIPNSNLAKMNYETIKSWIPFLRYESLDGWISSIENKTAVEIALINDPTILKLISCSPIKYNWTNSRYNNNSFIPKNWGTTYPLSTETVQMLLHSRFKPQIEAYLKQLAEDDPYGTAFSLLLTNANITYINSSTVENIRWNI